MKKIMPILLVILLMVGLMPVAAFAADDKTDKIIFNASASATSENGNFELSADKYGNYGWGIGPDLGTITISANNDKLTITSIDAVMGEGGGSFGYANFGGNLHKEPNGAVADGDTVSVSNINASEVSLTCKGTNIKFKDITVHYTGGSDGATGSILSEGNGVIICLIGVAAVIAVVVLVIMKKKKKVA